MRPVLLLDNYDSFTYNLFQYFEELGYRTRVVRNDAITVAGIRAADPLALVISPGPGDPSTAGVSLAAIRELSGALPILGVCLGHQAIGEAFGGRVIRAPMPMHGKVSRVRVRSRAGMLREMPSPFAAARYHSLIVERKSLPRCLAPTCESEDGLIMGLRHRAHLTEGVQFHPESIATEDGKRMLRNFLEEARRYKRRAG